MIRRLFNLYPGEGAKALQFGLMAFAAALAVFAGSSIADGLFLQHIGADALPLAYFMIAGGMLLMASLLLWALNRFPIRTIFLTLVLAEVLIFGIFAIQLLSHTSVPPLLWWILKVSQDVYIPLMLLGLWTFFDQCFDLQDAKRLAGMFSAAMILGAAAGGYLTSLLLASMAPAVVLGMMSGVLLVSVWMASTADRYAIAEPETQASDHLPLRTLLKEIVTSRFTLWLLLYAISMQLLETVAEYRYMDALTSVFPGGEEGVALTRFLSAARGFVYVGDVILGIFLYGRIIKRLGINNAIFLSPLLFFGAFFCFKSNAGLSPAIMGIILVEGVQMAITETNFNLVINGIPSRLKSRVRVAIEFFVEPVGMLFASGLLVLFKGETRILGLAIAAIALFAVIFLRRRYPKAIFKNLVESTLHFDKSPDDWVRSLPAREKRLAQKRLVATFEELTAGQKRLASEVLVAFDELAPMKMMPEEAEGEAPQLIERLRSSHNAKQKRLLLTVLTPLCDISHLPELVRAGTHLRPAERRRVEKILIGFGMAAVPALLALTKDASLDDRCRILAGRALGALAPSILRAELPKLAKQEVARAFFYFYHCETIQQRYPHHDLSLLVDGLRSSFHTVRDFLVHLLGIDDCELLCRALRSSNEKVHSQAVEILEKGGCDRRIFKLLLPLIDDSPLEEKLRLYVKQGYTPHKLPELLQRLSSSPLQVDRLVAAALKTQLALPGWQSETPLPQHPLANELVEA
jgi:hypothetical protein